MQKKYQCIVCKKTFSKNGIVSAPFIREPIAAFIRKDYPGWSDESYICHSDLSVYRTKYVHALLESDKGDLSELEQEVLESLKKHEIISSNVDDAFEQEWTFGEKLADKIAEFGGSWRFLIFFAIFLAIWIAINSFSVSMETCRPLSFHTFKPSAFMFGCDSSSHYYDEPEPTGDQRPSSRPA